MGFQFSTFTSSPLEINRNRRRDKKIPACTAQLKGVVQPRPHGAPAQKCNLIFDMRSGLTLDLCNLHKRVRTTGNLVDTNDTFPQFPTSQENLEMMLRNLIATILRMDELFSHRTRTALFVLPTNPSLVLAFRLLRVAGKREGQIQLFPTTLIDG